jgi:peptidoglycan hydrolase-like protein with peptidoglycan-binding domain
VIRKSRAMFIGLAAVILSSLVSWGAASRIRSPAEVAARTAPPVPSAITVPVEKKVLSSDVVVRGTVRYGAPISVILPASSIRKGNAILTSAPVKGKDLTEGGVAFTISGRPALVLQGAVPAYRDIVPGAVGEDVRQLQQALVRLGFRPGRTDGVYDDRTGLAVAAWYLKSGYSPSGPSEEQLAQLRQAQADWFSAESDLLGAQEGLSAAQHDYAIAQQKAGAAARAAMPPAAAATTPPATASSADSAAASRAEQERVSAAVRVGKARRAVTKANEEEKAAQARLDEARRRRPPPSNEEYATLARQAQEASNRAQAARDELSAAEDAYNAANGDRGSSGAGGHEGTSPTTADPSAKLDAATAAAEAQKAADAVGFAQRKVGLAGQRAASGLSGTKLGIQIPAGEILFFPTLPARIDDVKLKVGDETTGPVMTVTSSNLVVESALSAADAKLVKEGGAVTIKAPDSGVEATGTVSHVATTPGTNGADPQRYYLEVTPTALDAGLAGASVVQTISVSSTQGEVLAVPVAALSMASDGTTRVQVQPPRAPARYVTVEPGLSAKGLVAVTPLGGDLTPGDLVVVGANNAGSSSAGGGKGKQKGASRGKK